MVILFIFGKNVLTWSQNTLPGLKCRYPCFFVLLMVKIFVTNRKCFDLDSCTRAPMTFTKGVGTPAYMAPEILNREHYKKQSDVYSFAITMLEIMIWKEAFPKSVFRFPWNIADLISTGKRPQTIEEIQNKKIVNIIERSWCQNPRERLTIDDIVALLETELLKMKHQENVESFI